MIGFRAPGIALAASVMLLVAGCGGGSSTPRADNLINGMRAAVDAARSVHVSGSMVMHGKVVKIDMNVTKSGDASGRVFAGPAAYSVLITGGKAYMAPNSAYLKQIGVPAKYCPVLCDKYSVVGNSGQRAYSLSMSTILGNALAALNPRGQIVTQKQTVNGKPAWMLTTFSGTGYVAAQGKPFLLRVIINGSSLNFSQWNAVTIPGPPPASQMVDTSKLPG